MSTESPAEVMERARLAQRQWAALPVSERVRVLATMRRAIAGERESIVEAVSADTGKPALDALAGDVLLTLEQMRFYERHAARLLKPRKISKSLVLFPRYAFFAEFEPHGVALIFGPANYPFQLTMVPAITALYAGNAVVLKVSERTPRVAHKIEELVSEHLPANLLQVLTSDPSDAPKLIDAKPDVVFFTGSTRNGRDVAVRAASHLIPTIMELGGKDAAVVFADCDMERTVNGVAYGAFVNTGQVCVGIKRLYVEQSIYHQFLETLLQRVARLHVGTGKDSDLAPLHEGALKNQLQIQVEDALAQGARLEWGGNQCDGPTILTQVPPHARLLTEETFGPVLCVAPFVTEADAVALANSSSFALGASVWTGDFERGRRIASHLEAGTCSINDVIRAISNPAAGFGGNGASGYGRYHGAQGLLAFSRTKTIAALHSRGAQEVHWFPFTEKTRRSLDRLIELRHRPRGWLTSLRRLLSLLAVFGICCALHSQNVAAGDLRLDVRLPAGHQGRVAWAVFDSASGFPDDKTKSVRHGFSSSSNRQDSVLIHVGMLPAGRYAVAAYLDENDNGRLDKRFPGIPREPVGASNNPRSRLGPPHFMDCVFTLGAGQQTIVIRLVNPK